eukprot:755091-Hanusia_phi.AAC.3
MRRATEMMSRQCERDMMREEAASEARAVQGSSLSCLEDVQVWQHAILHRRLCWNAFCGIHLVREERRRRASSRHKLAGPRP